MCHIEDRPDLSQNTFAHKYRGQILKRIKKEKPFIEITKIYFVYCDIHFPPSGLRKRSSFSIANVNTKKEGITKPHLLLSSLTSVLINKGVRISYIVCTEGSHGQSILLYQISYPSVGSYALTPFDVYIYYDTCKETLTI